MLSEIETPPPEIDCCRETPPTANRSSRFRDAFGGELFCCSFCVVLVFIDVAIHSPPAGSGNLFCNAHVARAQFFHVAVPAVLAPWFPPYTTSPLLPCSPAASGPSPGSVLPFTAPLDPMPIKIFIRAHDQTNRKCPILMNMC